MNTKVASIGTIAVLVIAIASVEPAFAMGPMGPMIGPMSGSAPFVRASPYAGDVPGEPQSQANNPWARQAALSKTEMHFDLSQCQQVQQGLYNCTVADKPICNGDYSGQADCVRVGPNGSVYVLNGPGN